MTERDLIAALVGEYVELYSMSAVFYTQINTLAAMIPTWIDGMAKAAAQYDAQQQLAIESLMRGTKQ